MRSLYESSSSLTFIRLLSLVNLQISIRTLCGYSLSWNQSKLIYISIRAQSCRVWLVHVLLIPFLISLRPFICRLLSQEFLTPKTVTLYLLNTRWLLSLLLNWRYMVLTRLAV
jgi:hypothetical protein